MDDFLTNVPDPSLSSRDVEVLDLISQEELDTFTFDGLKRRLGLHSETLSRILNRLEQEELVEKGPEGYVVTGKINRFATPRPVRTERGQTRLLQTFIPTGVSIEDLVNNLKGRWFGMLRWLGCAERENEASLKWVTEEGEIQVAANISRTNLVIYAKFLGDQNMDSALTASHQLMTYISRVCSRNHLARNVCLFVGFDGQMMSA